MSDFPKVLQMPSSVISPWTYESIAAGLRNGSYSSNSTAQLWSGANTAVLVPFRVAVPTIIKQLFWVNGATVGTDSRDIGIYTSQGGLITSAGGTLTSGASAPQVINITDVTLNLGLYYMALVQNGTTDNLLTALPANPIGKAFGAYYVPTSYPLPSTVTLTLAGAATAILPFIGLTTQAVV